MSSSKSRPLAGMGPFLFVMVSYLINLIGSQMTRFGAIAWAWQETGSATAAGITTVAIFASVVVTSAVAGALADRWNRKMTLIVSDIISALATVVVIVLYATDLLQVWHLGVFGAVTGAIEAIQFPVYMASVTTMVPKEQYARANGMFMTCWTLSHTLAPTLTALLMARVGLHGVLLADLLTFVAIVGAVAMTQVPQPEASEQSQSGSFWGDVVFGFKYTFERPSLLGMVTVLGLYCIACGAYEGLLRPMVLSLTGDNTVILGQVLSATGVGGAVGGFLLSAWGGPKKRIHGILITTALGSLGFAILGFSRTLLFWAVGAFSYGFFEAIMNALIFAFMQAKVDPAVQGRVMSTTRLIVQGAVPLAVLGFTMVSDKVMEPAMAVGGWLAPIFGGLLGTGTGTGMSLVLIFAGVFGVAVGVLGYAFRSIRHADSLMADHDAEAQVLIAEGVTAHD